MSSPAPTTPTGSVLVGRYRVDALIGQGAMAEVHRATDLERSRAVAVKILRGQPGVNGEAVRRLKREGELLQAIRHRAIVHVEAVHELEDGAFLVMELLEGETLGARMRRGPMSGPALAPIVAGVAAGLAAAHARGIVHRDLKPDNIFLVPDHESGREGALQVKLLDFGISKIWHGEKLTQTGQVLGTPRYMSPEQLGAETDVDPRIDVYALGVILYEALTGTPPFLGSSPTDLIIAILHGKLAPPRSIRPDLSPALEAVVLRAMARKREARFDSAPELADAFLEAAGIDPSFRLAPKRGLETRALGSVGVDEPSGKIQLASTPPPPRGALPLKPGTFVELPAFDDHQAPKTLLSPMSIDDRATAAAPRAAHASTLLDGGAAPPAPAMALATTQPAMASIRPAPAAAPSEAGPEPAPRSFAPARSDEPRRVIPPTSLSPIEHGASRQAVATPPLAASREDPSPQREARRGLEEPRPPARDEAPKRRGWLWLGVIGLFVAGGLTAALALAIAHWLHARDEPIPPPPPPAAPSATSPPRDEARPEEDVPPEGAASPGADTPAPSAPSTTPATPSAEPSLAEPDAADSVVSGLDAPAATDRADDQRALAEPTRPGGAEPGVEGTPPSERRERRRTRPDPVADDGTPPPPTGSPAPSEDGDLLSVATRALRSGDPTHCVELLDELIGQGATPAALRRRGDCLLRLGQRAEAIRDYQRFCRLAPDHPAIEEVREVLEGLGQTCP